MGRCTRAERAIPHGATDLTVRNSGAVADHHRGTDLPDDFKDQDLGKTELKFNIVLFSHPGGSHPRRELAAQAAAK